MTGGKTRSSGIKSERADVGGIYPTLKRLFDILAAYILLFFLYVPMLLIAAVIKLTSRGSVIFRQERVGVGGRIFVCYKFRTMRPDAPPSLSTSEFGNADEYITAVGRFLRKTSLDELPQLFNVLGGDMSLVGPRPLIPSEREMHTRRTELGVYALRPGITGLAQICGRDTLSDTDKLEYDAEYKNKICFVTDLKIIFLTFFKVCSCEGVGLTAPKEGS